MSYYNYIKEWIKTGVENHSKYLLIVKDLEDKEYFPVYFEALPELKQYQNNIISESKLKVIEIFTLSGTDLADL